MAKTKSKLSELYTLNVFLVAGPVAEKYAGSEISRTILIKGNQTLQTLHNAIFDAFERFDSHLYAFYVGKLKNEREEIINPFDRNKYEIYTVSPDRKSGEKGVRTRIASLALSPGERFAYLFDFGDEWGHVIEVKAIEKTTDRKKYPKITERIGDAPPQYPDLDEEDDWDEED